MTVPGVDLDGFTAGLALAAIAVFVAWLPLASIALVRRLLAYS
jgi:hypothetical protein